jgi:hypothetical protein
MILSKVLVDDFLTGSIWETSGVQSPSFNPETAENNEKP